MEPHNTAVLLEKYFDGETTLAEEQLLRDYFASADVAPELEMYRPLFGYFENEKAQQAEISLLKIRKTSPWLSIAASIIVMISIGTFAYFNFQSRPKQDLGTYDSPEKAFQETKKALALLSKNVNTGVEGLQYLKTYENTKDRVFN